MKRLTAKGIEERIKYCKTSPPRTTFGREAEPAPFGGKYPTRVLFKAGKFCYVGKPTQWAYHAARKALDGLLLQGDYCFVEFDRKNIIDAITSQLPHKRNGGLFYFYHPFTARIWAWPGQFVTIPFQMEPVSVAGRTFQMYQDKDYRVGDDVIAAFQAWLVTNKFYSEWVKGYERVHGNKKALSHRDGFRKSSGGTRRTRRPLDKGILGY